MRYSACHARCDARRFPLTVHDRHHLASSSQLVKSHVTVSAYLTKPNNAEKALTHGPLSRCAQFMMRLFTPVVQALYEHLPQASTLVPPLLNEVNMSH